MEDKESGSVTIKIKKEDFWKYSTFVLVALLILGAFMFFGKSSSNVVNNPSQNLPSTSGSVEVSEDDDAVLGNKNAPVVIIEFSDYQCPFCRKFWTETFSLLKKNYIDTGKVKLVFRDFPLESIHPMAVPSAIAAECVREKGGDEAYFKFHDKMFEEQNIIDSGSAAGPVTKTAAYSNSDLKAWAKDLGYNIDSCLDSEKYANEVSSDLNDGASVGVQGTPAFFVNGKLLSGAQPYSAFKAAIDAELA